MKYLDSGTRLKEQALGYWIDQEQPASMAQLRFQTGYFSINGLSAFKGIIQALVNGDQPISTVIGSNEKDTTKSDVEHLISLIGCPRKRAQAAVVSYSNGLFHPKVVHLTRTDGSQFAYVGSANLTATGVAAGNIEAGLLLDSNDGDPITVLNDIAARIDSWFDGSRPEASIVTSNADVQKLADDGILGLTKPKRVSQGSNGATSTPTSKPPLKHLMGFPAIVSSSTNSSAANGNSTSAPTNPSPSVAPASLPVSTANEILIAEIGKGDRWKQANFPMAMMQNYFGVNPVANDLIRLHEVDISGTVGDVVDTKVVNVQSQNYRIELSAVSGIPYPASGRPIGVFRKIASKEFRYRIFMPNDPDHATFEKFLAANYAGPSRQLKRVIISPTQLQTVWSSCPV